MKSTSQIITKIIENALAKTNEELEEQFRFFAQDAGWDDKKIETALKSPWFPWIDKK